MELPQQTGRADMSQPRKHHYVPAFYLAGFTANGDRKGPLHVLDLQAGRRWQSTPDDAGCERDFYRLENGAEDPVAVERLFGAIESRAAAVVRTVFETGKIPEGDDYAALCEFLATLTIRVPGTLAMIDNLYEEILKKVARLMVSSPEQWSRQMDQLREAGNSIPEGSYEGVRKMVEEDAYTVKVNQNERMHLILEMGKPAIPLMMDRKWAVVQAPPQGPGFICSDRPVSLSWSDGKTRGWMPPGFGLRGTSVAVPLSRTTAVHGIFEAQLPSRLLNPTQVGIFNFWTAIYAERFVYSAEPDFKVTLKDGSLAGPDAMVEIWSEARKRQGNEGA